MPNSPRADFAQTCVDLAQPRLGAEVIHATDDFFAPKERLIAPGPPVFIPDKYDDHGKWMDGWETRRRRRPGHDHCTLRLGVPGVIEGVDIDTSHFTGNHPAEAALEACWSDRDPGDGTAWTGIVPRTRLDPDSHHLVAVDSDRPWTHVRLHIFPDGGVARLRVFGIVHRDWSRVDKARAIDLIALENGGRVLACNDRHFGSPENLLAPGGPVNMGDGWETRRRRGPGNDWVVIALGHRGDVRRIEVDTAHFKGNYPDACRIEAVDCPGADTLAALDGRAWHELLPRQKLEMDRMHVFESEVRATGPITHVRFEIHPDGGVGRLRLHGHIVR